MNTSAPPLVEPAAVEAAERRIAGLVHHTPMFSAMSLGVLVGAKLLLKAELFQRTGSFKVRGVLNRLATMDPAARSAGLVTLSAGNHAAALAKAAGSFQVPATVVMAANANAAKIAATESYGAEIVLTERPLMEVTEELRVSRGLTLVHPFDDPEIIAGAGTVGLEIVREVPEFDTIVVPIGGGGLISGVAVAVRAARPDVQIIGVEPETADVMSRSLVQGRPAHLDGPPDTVADGLGAPFAGEHTYRHVAELVDRVVRVSEDHLRKATRLQMERTKLYAEPAGAAPMAAVLGGAFPIPPGNTVVCVVSGGNVNRETLRGLL